MTDQELTALLKKANKNSRLGTLLFFVSFLSLLGIGFIFGTGSFVSSELILPLVILSIVFVFSTVAKIVLAVKKRKYMILIYAALNNKLKEGLKE